MTKIIYTSILLFGLFSIISAQKFKLEAKLEKLEKTDFYKIKLSPKLISAMENFPYDIRITDSANKPVAYIFNDYKNRTKSLNSLNLIPFDDFAINRNAASLDIIINNKQNKFYSKFYLVYKNFQKGCCLRVYGSYDTENWQLVSDSPYHSEFNKQGTLIELVALKECRFTYFKISIENLKGLPAKVTKVGFIPEKIPGKDYVKLGAYHLEQSNLPDKKISIVKVLFDNAQLIDFMKITISGNELYNREVYLFDNEKSVNKVLSNSIIWDYEKSFKINSSFKPNIPLNSIKLKKMYLLIDNKDNPALNIDSIEFYQKKYFLTARLEENKSYFIRCGNKFSKQAEYDLQYFKGIIPKELSTVKIVEIKQINKKVKNKGFRPDTKTIWLVIIILAGILLYITTAMLKKTDN